MSALPTPVAGNELATVGRCASCSSPLAADQLFCLSCGARRREARIAFRDVLATEAMPVVSGGGGGGLLPPAAVAGQPAPGGGVRANYMPFLATIALLLFAIGLGFWMGRKQTPTAVASGVPVQQQVVASTPVASTPDAAAAADASASKDDTASTDESSAPVKDDTAALKKLQSLSPEEYAKQSQKLPTEVGTGGKAPPKDNKAGGGGSAFEDFQ